MKRILYTLFISIVLPIGAFAQSAPSFALDDCIRYALENTIDVKNARVDEQIAAAKVKETFGIGLPQVDGSVALQHNQKLPRFFATYATAQGFAGKDENGDPNLDLPGVEPGDIVAAQNFFQLKSSGNAGLSINQLLFNSSYLVGLKAAGTYKELSEKAVEQTQIQVIENVTKAYYSVLVNSERILLFDNNIARVDSLLRTTTALNENGFAEAIDVDRIRVTLNNLKSERLKFINLQNLSLGLLKFQMNYPMEKELEVAGSLATLKVNENLFNEYQQGWDYKNRIEFKVLDTQRKLQELDIKYQHSGSLPSLVGFANLGYSTQSPNIGGLFATNTNIKDDGAIGPDKWYSYSSFGISLRVPLFSGLQRTYQAQQAKLGLIKIENSYTSLKQGIDLSIQQNTIIYKNAIETLNSQKENMGLAERVARVTKIKYEQGVGSNIEVTDAESSLRESQVNYYNALFDAIVAKIDLDKAYAKINPSQYLTIK
ncbi:MAG: TolC family protein [Cyclobacteriaceae bacterium]|nr:TolC family protein [Cyclobacteriaceae bacterium]MDH4295568.1 TolC family protein [Cyclobacteriaceae bacterium]MDH5248726.1 TolC family protein [Cyclobacteriaceae bacterium]